MSTTNAHKLTRDVPRTSWGFGFEASLGPDRRPALGRGVVIRRLRFSGQFMLRLALFVSAATPVLLMLNFVSRFAYHIRSRTGLKRGWVARPGRVLAIGKVPEVQSGTSPIIRPPATPTTIAPLSGVRAGYAEVWAISW